MKLFTKSLVVAGVSAALALGAAGVGAAPAQAINYPDPVNCAWNTTFGADDYLHLKIANFSTGQITPLCYVNAGVMTGLNVTNVWGIHSGNNAGWIEFHTDFWGVKVFPKWYDDSNYYGTVAEVEID
ncbi:hypothetical protein [Psychromicrobium sp. YIM B11713]|uniref:hypothetical protein n=1 Tax=Psychromicrobium sp. YIM B11713 TaxID=3145233 RepID=UPI00374EEED8